MSTADGKPSDDDPRENGPRLGDEHTTLVEEYAGHMGHVDLFRERIDGRPGQ